MRKRGLISVLILSLLLSSIIPHKIQAVTEQAKTAKISEHLTLLTKPALPKREPHHLIPILK